MRIRVFVECDYCTNDIEIVEDKKMLKLPLNSKIRNEARRLGWHLGRKCICPECLSMYADRRKCATCRHWRNKIMESPCCTLDGELALAQDSCESHVGGGEDL